MNCYSTTSKLRRTVKLYEWDQKQNVNTNDDGDDYVTTHFLRGASQHAHPQVHSLSAHMHALSHLPRTLHPDSHWLKFEPCPHLTHDHTHVIHVCGLLALTSLSTSLPSSRPCSSSFSSSSASSSWSSTRSSWKTCATPLLRRVWTLLTSSPYQHNQNVAERGYLPRVSQNGIHVVLPSGPWIAMLRSTKAPLPATSTLRRRLHCFFFNFNLHLVPFPQRVLYNSRLFRLALRVFHASVFRREWQEEDICHAVTTEAFTSSCRSVQWSTVLWPTQAPLPTIST